MARSSQSVAVGQTAVFTASASGIHRALEVNDAATLASKVDFPAVRASLRPVVTAEVERALDKAAAGAGRGLGQFLSGALKDKLAPTLVDAILNRFVTPKNLGELYLRRKDIREILAERASRRAANAGGAGKPEVDAEPSPDDEPANAPPNAEDKRAATAPQNGRATAATGARPRMGLSNIKRVAFTGPLSIEVGVARERTAKEPDVTAQLAFRNFDWRLVGLIPKAR